MALRRALEDRLGASSQGTQVPLVRLRRRVVFERLVARLERAELAFAGVPAPVVEVIDAHRHAAEKFQAMLRDYGDRENSRVRDLVDLVVMIEHDS
jgi:hypothetical protein